MNLARMLLISVYDDPENSKSTRLMQTLRTPDSRFENLPDYDFAPNYADVDGLRMHYIDEGPKDGAWCCYCTANRAGPTCIAI